MRRKRENGKRKRNWQSQVLARKQSNWKSHTLLVAMQNDAVTLGNRWEWILLYINFKTFLEKKRNRIIIIGRCRVKRELFKMGDIATCL